MYSPHGPAGERFDNDDDAAATADPTKPSRFLLVGAGFWARFQLLAWLEVEGVRCVGVCDPDHVAAERLAALAPGARAFSSLADALAELGGGNVDFVDIVTPPSTHADVVLTAIDHGLPAICQKPLAAEVDDAERIVAAAQASSTPVLVHENWRWQRQLRAVAAALPTIGTAFRASIRYNSSFAVFENQPSLRSVPRFILLDMGPHIFDLARFLFGDPNVVFARTSRVTPGIVGEDVATVSLGYASGLTVTCEISYASQGSEDAFPQTALTIEGTAGTIELRPGYELTVTTPNGSSTRQIEPTRYGWSEEPYTLVQDAIVACNRHLLSAIAGDAVAETPAGDNIRSLDIVFAAYESAERGVLVGASGRVQ